MPFALLFCYLFWLMPIPSTNEKADHSTRHAIQNTNATRDFFRFFWFELAVVLVVQSFQSAWLTLALLFGNGIIQGVSPDGDVYSFYGPIFAVALVAVLLSVLLLHFVHTHNRVQHIALLAGSFLCTQVIQMVASFCYLAGASSGLAWLLCLAFAGGFGAPIMIVDRLIAEVDAQISSAAIGYLADGLSAVLIAALLIGFDASGSSLDSSPNAVVTINAVGSSVAFGLLIIALIVAARHWHKFDDVRSTVRTVRNPANSEIRLSEVTV